MRVACYAAGKENILSALKLTWCVMGTLQLVNSGDVVMQAIMYSKNKTFHTCTFDK